MLRQTLVTVTADHKALAGTLTTDDIAAFIVDSPQSVAGAGWNQQADQISIPPLQIQSNFKSV